MPTVGRTRPSAVLQSMTPSFIQIRTMPGTVWPTRVLLSFVIAIFAVTDGSAEPGGVPRLDRSRTVGRWAGRREGLLRRLSLDRRRRPGYWRYRRGHHFCQSRTIRTTCCSC